MSFGYLKCFLNTDRPQILDPSVLELPVELLGEEVSSELKRSLLVDVSDGCSCASSARLWESLLEHHRIPYLLLRVADMRMTLGNKVTALALYDELEAILADRDLEAWISHLRLSIAGEKDRLLRIYHNNTEPNFTPSQRWIPTASDPFPYCKVKGEYIQDMLHKWRILESSEGFTARFLSMHCLETNYVEGTFLFNQSDNDLLVEHGFYSKGVISKLRPPVGGAVRSLNEVLNILQDTYEALSEIYTFTQPLTPDLTVDLVCRLHAKLMKTSRVLYNETRPRNGRLTYLNVGVTRQTSRVNVTASSVISGHTLRVQFCPYDDVDAELELFCRRFNEIIHKDDMDPFACAAWISHTFVAIHPFEDGNGRLSRILSSIPLARRNLPPLYISASSKDEYLLHLNRTRATPRFGDYEGLMQMLQSSTMAGINYLISDYNESQKCNYKRVMRRINTLFSRQYTG